MAVARHRHFTRAADELYLTQSAVSQQVRRLEAELGVELFVRGTVVALTPAGEELLPRALGVLGALQDAVAAVSGAARGTVRVAAEYPAGLAAAVAAFHREHPAVRVSFEGGDVYVGGAAPVGWTVVSRHLTPLVVVGLAQAVVELQALKGRTIVLPERAHPLRAVVDAAFAACGFGAVPVFEASDVAATLALVDAGVGVALLPGAWARGAALAERVDYEIVVAVRPGAPPAAERLSRGVGGSLPSGS